MDKDEEKALKNIEKNGCHIIHVMEEGGHPCFTYSIGVEKRTGMPEVIITGFDSDMSHFLINEYNSRIIDGETFEPDKFYEDFLDGFEVTFKEVEKKHYSEYFGWGEWLYKGEDFKALQLIWPSTSGQWPWDKKVPKDYKRCLPRLYKS